MLYELLCRDLFSLALHLIFHFLPLEKACKNQNISNLFTNVNDCTEGTREFCSSDTPSGNNYLQFKHYKSQLKEVHFKVDLPV